MGDDASCLLWKLDDTHLVAHFNSTYPQTKSWKMHHLSQPAHAFQLDLLALPGEQAKAVTAKRANAKREHWKIWSKFCHDMGLDPSLFYVRDPVPFLQVFM
jgi:hypothetical protein